MVYDYLQTLDDDAKKKYNSLADSQKDPSERKKVDHNPKPRRRLSAFMFYVNACRKVHKEKHPNKLFVMGGIGEKWKVNSS